MTSQKMLPHFVQQAGSITLLGFGKTTLSVAYFLLRQGVEPVRLCIAAPGAQAGKDFEALAQAGVRVAPTTFELTQKTEVCVVSPGISDQSPLYLSAKENSQIMMGDIELAWRARPQRWLALTGSNGKTTTTTLTAHLLQEAGVSAQVVGNIGVCACDVIDKVSTDTWLVAELSSFQLASTIDFHPQAAALLNISPDHLEWHKTMERYVAAKEMIFANLTPSELAILPASGPWIPEISTHLSGHHQNIARVSLDHDPHTALAAFVEDGNLMLRTPRQAGVTKSLCAVEDLQIAGAHNVENSLFAAVLATAAGIDTAHIAHGLTTFKPLEHRLEPAGEVAGVRYVNDSKATNTDATQKALKSFKKKTIVVLLGGHDKKTPLEDLAVDVCTQARAAICFGEAGPRIAQALETAKNRLGAPLELKRAQGLREAFELARHTARAGEVVLLSPACSSFDEFHNMEERGALFKELVRQAATCSAQGSAHTQTQVAGEVEHG